MMELLSPAGSREALVAAVQNGADAVYMGGSAFNARRFASNFDNAALQEAVDYCHIRGVKAYVTLNILVLDREMQEAAKYAEFLCRSGVDAVIIQDIGLAGLLHREIPELPLHASTQMGIHTLEGARIAKKLGMERVVLSRETPLNRIKKIRDGANVEIEAFAHGALCMSFSGGCLLSSMAGERSGNRGTCAQPCRKKMSVSGIPGKNDYCLSLGDLCMIEHLADMERAGVDCIKLEGRMKRAEYVAVVTRAYRNALDGADPADIAIEKQRMLDMFDRGGGSTGYFYGNGTRTGFVAESDRSKDLLKQAAQSYEKESRKRGVNLELTLNVGEKAHLMMECGGVYAEAYGDEVRQANKPQSSERYAEQAKKLGDTPFVAEGCIVNAPETAFMPASAINALRRDCAQNLEQALCIRRECGTAVVENTIREKVNSTTITAIVRTKEQAKAAFEAGADEVALEPTEYTEEAFEALQPLRKKGRLLMSLPVVMMSPAESSKIRNIGESGLVDGAITGNIGQLELVKNLPLKIAGSQMNAMNSHTVEEYIKMGYNRVTLSLELTKPQLRDICGRGTALSVYGRAQLMQLRHCPIKEYKGCKNCKGIAGELTDEGGRKFILSNIRQADGCTVRLLNCVPTDILDLYSELPRSESIQIAFYDETPALVADRVKVAIQAEKGETVQPVMGSTRGHWARPVQ